METVLPSIIELEPLALVILALFMLAWTLNRTQKTNAQLAQQQNNTAMALIDQQNNMIEAVREQTKGILITRDTLQAQLITDRTAYEVALKKAVGTITTELADNQEAIKTAINQEISSINNSLQLIEALSRKIEDTPTEIKRIVEPLTTESRIALDAIIKLTKQIENVERMRQDEKLNQANPAVASIDSIASIDSPSVSE